ncbi:MAG: nitroreductase family protein [Deltaproteobacteria bacterium]|nr:nitroreductase family protein [Deltaproteobacteria bacterium]
MEIQDRLGNAHFPPTRFAQFVVDPDRCKACGKCVATCPGQILELREKLPVDTFAASGGPFGCIGCNNCYAVCPDEAIEIRGQYRVKSGFYKTLLREPALPNPFRSEKAPVFDSIAGDLTEVERVIYRRRSNRLFSKKPVPEETLHRVLEAGRFAPSGGNCQPWSFIVISDRDLLDRIGEQCKKSLKALPALYKNRNGRPEPVRKIGINLFSRIAPSFFDQRVIAGSDTVANNEKWDTFLHAPSLIIVLADTRGIGDPMLDCSLAAHNMVLTAHSLGLGSCYVGFIKAVQFIPSLKRELGIEWPYKIITSIALGYPRTRTDKAVARERPPITWFPANRSGPITEE